MMALDALHEAPIVQAATLDPSVLTAGMHLVEVSFARPVLRVTLERALRQMGFSESSVDESQKLQNGCIPANAAVTFVGRLARSLRLVDTDDVHWLDCHGLATNPFADLHCQLIPFTVSEGRRYEIRFIARMKAHPTREHVEEVLRSMRGFEIEKLVALRKDTRIPDCPGTSVTVWFAIARWFGPHSPVNMDDPVSFEEVKEVPGDEP